MSDDRRPEVVFVHSSDEMFGADRILLEVVGADGDIHPRVWLPDDVPISQDPLHRHLWDRDVEATVRPLPILRRRYLTPRHIPGLLVRAARLWRALRRARPAAVYCATSAALLAAPMARLAGVPVVVVHVQEIWSDREALLLGALARCATSIVAISEAVRSALPETLARRTRVLVNASADVADPAPRPLSPDNDSVGVRPMTFLVASRWNSWKGHATLLEAWNSISPPAGRLLIAGSPPEAGLGVDVRGMVAQLTWPESVEFVGQLKSLTEVIDSSDVVVVPSDDPEPFGLIAIEAFGRFRPVIGSRAGGLGHIITDGHTGVLFENRSAQQLADALRHYDRPTARADGIAARADFERSYSTTRFHEGVRAIWRDALGAGGSDGR